MKIAVIGHVEMAEFAPVERVPKQGDIIQVPETFEVAAGGAAVAAVQIARLAGSCLFMTAIGSDRRADLVVPELAERGLRVEAARRSSDQRRAFVYLDAEGERTITTIGERVFPEAEDPLPWDELAGFDAVYLTAGNAGTLRAARAAKNVVATVRAGAALTESGVQVDVLVASANDVGEQYLRGDIEPAPRWVVRTDGSRGGSLETADGTVTHWASHAPIGPRVDTYGAGDSFAGGITYGLGRGLPIEEAIAVGAFCGASAVRGRGPYGAQASAEELSDGEKTLEVSP
ncbi:MAG: ribokinase [Thermoleophilia bacterium]|nr:ribokinase [Thermoleophilia bacterium]